MFISADETGMAFVHTLSRKLVVANVATTRILGRYPERVGSERRPVKPHKPSCVLGMAGLPLGSVKFITDEMQLVGMLSPYKVFHTPGNLWCSLLLCRLYRFRRLSYGLQGRNALLMRGVSFLGVLRGIHASNQIQQIQRSHS